MNRFSREEIHRLVYLFGLAFLICCLPLSKYLMSISQFLLGVNWIVEGNFRQKFRILRQNPSILLFASVFLLYAAGILYSEDTGFALNRLKNALPLLVIPIIIGTTPLPGIKNIYRLLLLFCAAVITASVICLVNYLVNGIPSGSDFRKISVFMTHTRFSLLINMAIAILVYFALQPELLGNHIVISGRKLRLPLVLAALFLAFFLFFLRSATGIVLFGLLAFTIVLHYAFKKKKKIRYICIILAAGISMAALSLVLYTWQHNFTADPVDPAALETFTVNGNRYVHDTATGVLENGYYTDIYFCEPELRQEWNKLSSFPYDSLDLKGQDIRFTIKRYLTSRGLRKDSVGLHELGKADLQNIVKGHANYKFRDDPGVNQRLYETLFEIHILCRTGYVQHHSLGQRLVFYKEALALIRQNFFIGVGTGDVHRSMLRQAAMDNIAVDPRWEGKPHNQFAFLWIAFGIIGLSWTLLCWIIPVLKSKTYRQFLFNSFALVILLSMLVIDTLELYDSIVFFAFFYSLFVFGNLSKNIDH